MQLLDNPAFKRAYSTTQQTLLEMILRLKHDGSPEAENFEREACRSLRNLECLRRALSLAGQNQQLREADFRPQEPATDD